MRKAESVPVAVPIVALRAACIFLGTTWVAHRLATGIGAGPGAYTASVAAGFRPDRSLIEAAGRTLLLGAGALVAAAGLGAGLAGLLRWRPGGRSAGVGLGLATGPLLALTVPGLALYPLARAIGGRHVVLTGGSGPPPDGVGYLVFWWTAIGLTLAPSTAALLAGAGREWGAFGLDLGWAPLASRPDPHPRWRLGFPTMVLLAALASVEALTGTEGLFAALFEATASGDATRAMDIVVPVAAAGAALAVAIDLLGRRSVTTGSEVAAEPLGRGRGAVPLLVLALALVGLAVVGAGLDPTDADADALLVGPLSGGRWLGTDGVGRSLAARAAAALGPALLAALLPAAGATAAGALIARGRRVLPERLGGFLDALVDLLWWPAPMVLALALWADPSAEVPSLEPLVLVVTGALLVPPASRMVGRTVSYRSTHRRAVRIQSLLFLAAMALALHLLVGFVGPEGSPARPTLGAMAASGLPLYGASPWPMVVPLATSAAVALALAWLGSAVARPAGPSRPRRSRSSTRAQLPAGPETVAATDGERSPAELIGIGGSSSDGGDAHVADDSLPDGELTGGAALVEVEIEGAEIIGPDRPESQSDSGARSDTRFEAEFELDPFYAPNAAQLEAEDRLAAELASAGRVDLTARPAPDGEEPNQPEPALVEPEPTEPGAAPAPDHEFDATRTIRLRPADLRRAGIVPPKDRAGLARPDPGKADPDT